MKPGEDPPFKTEAEKDEAIIKALSDFRGKHPGSKAAISAAVGSASPTQSTSFQFGMIPLALEARWRLPPLLRFRISALSLRPVLGRHPSP